ncbi:hypothetical protein B834_2657 [Enterococcus mundtii 1A]|nr:hypothetical protein AK89_01760 [Enterococcus mundtii CRL35]MDA9430126.1 hypothetical protein [Enterococcus mundtii 1A]
MISTINTIFATRKSCQLQNSRKERKRKFSKLIKMIKLPFLLKQRKK